MIIDLTHTLQNNITVYPGTLEPRFEIGNTIEKDGFAELNMSMCTHTGTHMDAPCHIIAGTKSLDEFPLTKFIGRGVVIDCTKVNAIELDVLRAYEKKIAQADFVLFYTGWQAKWNTPNYFDAFPVLTTEAVKWLLNFNLKALGFDAISVDAVANASLTNHNLLLPKEILIIENMTNLDKLINKDFELNCIPLKIGKADGSPIRAFARLEQ
jgi:kynurenine formamidase